MRTFGLVQRFGQEGDAPRGFPPRYREAAVYPPKIGQTGWIEPLAAFRWRTQRLSCASYIVLKEPRFGQRTPDLDLFVAGKTRLAEAADQKRSRFSPHSALEGVHGLHVKISR